MGGANSTEDLSGDWSHFTCSSCQGQFEGQGYSEDTVSTFQTAWYCLDCRARVCSTCYLKHPSTEEEREIHARIPGINVKVVHRTSRVNDSVRLSKSEDFTRSIEVRPIAIIVDELDMLYHWKGRRDRFKSTRCLFFDSDDEVSDLDESHRENESNDLIKAVYDQTNHSDNDFNCRTDIDRRSLYGLACPIHLRNHLDLFCGEHLQTGCHVCMAVSHRDCAPFIEPYHVLEGSFNNNDSL